MAKTRFSVLIPVYNRAACVRECIDSILAQTFLDYEIIAIDDGSTDGTQEVLRSYGDRIKVLKQDNQGPEIARNLGAVHAGGEYLAFLDEKLEGPVSLLSVGPDREETLNLRPLVG